MPRTYKIVLVLISLLSVWILNISLGSVNIPFSEIFDYLLSDMNKENWEYTIIEYRLLKSITAILVGSGLSVCGLFMQNIFQNPLAGPYVLGVSSGSSLGVAVFIMGSAFFTNSLLGQTINSLSMVLSSCLGALGVFALIMTTSIRVKNTLSVLIVGLMFSSFASAIVNVLSFFSESEKLQQFVFWTFGSLSDLDWNDIYILLGVFVLSILLFIKCLKPMNSLKIGENYAQSMGVSVKTLRNTVFFVVSILTGVITAYVGPIAFIGLAVPHLAKLLVKTTDIRVLFLYTAILGAIVLLVCDTIAQLPGSQYSLPINAVTSLFGAPIVIFLILKKQ
ncbi:MAG: iron ABC transporter permease [Flavobacteriaceae bacterium]|nr:iron ABC transporter permease [Flavobacteriaceae bacterium]